MNIHDQGEPGDDFYIIVDGSATVTQFRAEGEESQEVRQGFLHFSSEECFHFFYNFFILRQSKGETVIFQLKGYLSILGKVDWLAIQNKAFLKNVNFELAEKGNDLKMLVQMYPFYPV